MKRALLAVLSMAALEGCASHSEKMLPVRTALDLGQPQEALRLLDEAAGVKSDEALPAALGSDQALYVLDRGSVQQSMARFAGSKRDLEAADKAVDKLDIAHDAGDSIGEYVFSGSSGRYRAPPHEKLLINTLGMLNYLEARDLGGARVEARRLAVMERYIRDDLHEEGSTSLGLGAFLAGFVFEKSDQPDEALRWYDQALDFTGYLSLRDPARALMARGQYRSPRLRQLESEGAPPPSLDDSGEGELVFVVGYGRVPPKVPERIPIGLALTLYAGALSPANAAAANAMAAQGLVTWINFPALGREQGQYSVPVATLDGRYVQLEQAADVAADVREEWKKVEGRVIVSALSRMAVRFAAGTAMNVAGGSTSNGWVGALLAVGSIGTQATLAALDTPDTRSWETLPARVAVARVRVPAGRHAIRIDARGYIRTAVVDVERGGWAVVSAMGLR